MNRNNILKKKFQEKPFFSLEYAKMHVCPVYICLLFLDFCLQALNYCLLPVYFRLLFVEFCLQKFTLLNFFRAVLCDSDVEKVSYIAFMCEIGFRIEGLIHGNAGIRKIRHAI